MPSAPDTDGNPQLTNRDWFPNALAALSTRMLKLLTGPMLWEAVTVDGALLCSFVAVDGALAVVSSRTFWLVSGLGESELVAAAVLLIWVYVAVDVSFSAIVRAKNRG